MPKEKDKQSNFGLIQRIREEEKYVSDVNIKFLFYTSKLFKKKSSIEVY